jgi:hypothetical protein
MPERDIQAIESQMMGLDIALCALIETVGRVQPAVAKALAEDIRSQVQLRHSGDGLPPEATRKAVAYAEIIERVLRGENPGKQNPGVSAPMQPTAGSPAPR